MLLLLLLLVLTPGVGTASGGDEARHREDKRERETCEVTELRALTSPSDDEDRYRLDGAWADDGDDGRTHRRRRSFSAARTIDLGFAVSLKRARPHADRRVELRLYTPKGHLYQRLKLDPPRRVRWSRPGDPEWTGTLPVAGTAIVNHSLYGRWRVEPHLDDRPEPCGAAASLWIQP